MTANIFTSTINESIVYNDIRAGFTHAKTILLHNKEVC